ncbi:aldehyde:ferredoxin oxidoreductase [Paucidesulfovibrio gracilis DSM 16080]|uniref:Aldehyde:ferredoxin oxidoreductase n=1 Tax=Paucidesulfovibrio gracilis DSM 16080 TaxID=1121449 RepID=A0A1T4Y0T7_9BACT|nr:aldehyde ferredoxin oxidoreductase C-terminal domain-containing protein [Paucidesulfovibrio gracilis]SKA95434.1 aldehyde:ferredoxin oxidoreductase [Paucidesulfovibrio gracilis DSM 16080]
MKILRINTRTREFTYEEPGKYLGLGGRALTSRLVKEEVPATCDALSADNKLVAAGGVLTGTAAANSGRLSVGAKSPLTGTIKESNTGGSFAQKLAKLGILALVLEDKPDDGAWFNILVTKDGVEIVETGDMLGLGTYDSMDKVRDRYGKKACGMIVGPAGEKLRRAASIQFSDPEGRPARAAGRGGLGAVMGSKQIKAIVLDDSGCSMVASADKDAFRAANKRWVEILKGHPVTSEGLPAFGTSILVNIINEAGALPTKNFRHGRFEHAADISGETIAETIKQRGGKTKHGCHPGCVIQCSQEYVDAAGKYLTSGFEYETVWGFGANTLIKDIDTIATLDRICDDMGLDTIDMGGALGVAMEGGAIEWGDGETCKELLRKVATDDDLAATIGDGTAATGKKLGVTRVPVVKGQSLPAYDPRAVKGVGVTYATTTMGADHTAGYAVCQNILKVGGDVNPLDKMGQVETSKNLQIATAALDAAGLCIFVAFAVLDAEDGVSTIADMVSAHIGQPFTVEDVVKLGTSVLEDEIDFNTAAGFTKDDDQLPAFFSEETLEPHGVTWDFSVEELQAAKVK